MLTRNPFRSASGQIVTFYSYKGGTGRSQLLANAAWILAANGHRVLAVDWDLEAPGLHRFFRPFLIDRDLTASKGLIDLVQAHFHSRLKERTSPTAGAAGGAVPSESGAAGEWDFLEYVVSLRVNDQHFEKFGKLDLLPAGMQGPSYATRVNTFDWQKYYSHLGGADFLDVVKEWMKGRYDYVLVDSRTGISDTSGICTVQMPDDLVICFTLNIQSIEGASGVAASVRSQRPEKEFRILPVPTRVETGEKDRLDLAHSHAEERFAEILKPLVRDGNISAYWGEVEVSYWEYYAFEEILAPFADRPGKLNSISASSARILERLIGEKLDPVPEMPAPLRQYYLDQFLRKPGREDLRDKGETEKRVNALERSQRIYKLATLLAGIGIFVLVTVTIVWRFFVK